MKQKGSAQLLIIFAAVLILVLAGAYLYPELKDNNNFSQITNSIPVNNPLFKEYSNKTLGFNFKYPNSLNAKEDSEEDFNKRGNGDFRKNFKGYVAYEPGKFFSAVSVLDKSNSYDINPFTIWVFDNPNDLTIDQWYKNYWYYPFVWGDFTYKGKYEPAPKDDATVSGQIGKSAVVDYTQGKPKFIYLSKNQKMYLFRVIGETGDKILENLKFL